MKTGILKGFVCEISILALRVNVWHLLQYPHVFNVNKVMSDIDQAVKHLLENKWRTDINSEISHIGRGRNKLRIYRLFKHSFGPSDYLTNIHLTPAHYSVMPKMRCGVAPVCLETGRYEGLTEQERLHPVCDINEIESDIHVMIFYTFIIDIRATHVKCYIVNKQ